MKNSFIVKSLAALLLSSTLAVAGANSSIPTAVSLTGSKANLPTNVLEAASKLLNKTKVVEGITVADKGNNPAKYFDGGIIVGEQAKGNIENFDELDFEVFSHQDWVNFHKSHADNIVVSWPDGHETYGIDRHIADLKWLFSHAPDTNIKLHPVKIAAGNWTAVQGLMEGTFTKPMKLADGSEVQPTGKVFKLPMATFALWKDGKIIHEWLFWDNQTYMKQLGLSK
ncbi:MAG: hypothetical protein B7Y23_10040 [Sulfurovum sp. 16-42-52]|jgi:predicted ester cyclase|nr:MAG: hypothetical protein B7Y23_10040 [Sulfurovum sp. 16-42-52]OZA43152.1 MAG: hypothetical protein B7X80_09630 [Sulfurovum sp. 17-42-90]